MARSGHLAGWGSEQGAKHCLAALRVDEAGGVCNEASAMMRFSQQRRVQGAGL